MRVPNIMRLSPALKAAAVLLPIFATLCFFLFSSRRLFNYKENQRLAVRNKLVSDNYTVQNLVDTAMAYIPNGNVELRAVQLAKILKLIDYNKGGNEEA